MEEICNWWASIETSEFAEKENVRKNFIECFLALFDKSMGATNFDDFDFSKIKAHLDRLREIRLGRPAEEKKQEAEEKLQKEKLLKYCLYDGKLEKVSNYMVEPPGIFRGRGEHPQAGKLKGRIVPEYVQINVG